MKERTTAVFCTDGYPSEIEDLREAMFIEGARALGVAVHEPIQRENLEKILLAASSMAERLTTLLAVLDGTEGESEIGN